MLFSIASCDGSSGRSEASSRGRDPRRHRGDFARSLDPFGRGRSGTARARGALRRSEDVLTPSIPDDAPLAPLKRMVIRAARFLWRNQSSFNSLSLAASSELADRSRPPARRDLPRGGRARASRGHSGVAADPRRVRSRVCTRPRRGGGSRPAAGGLPAGVYALFEERFRGSPAAIAEASASTWTFSRTSRAGPGRGMRSRRVPATAPVGRNPRQRNRVQPGHRRRLPSRGAGRRRRATRSRCWRRSPAVGWGR